MNSKLPPYLQSTASLIERGYPNSIPSEDYLPLLHLLSNYLSINNLNTLMSEFYPEKRTCYNDIMKAMEDKPSVANVLDKLNQVGFDEWKTEE